MSNLHLKYENTIINQVIDEIANCLIFFSEATKNYLASFAKIYQLSLFLSLGYFFNLSKFFSEQFGPNSALICWVLLIYLCLTIYLSSFCFPNFFVNQIKNIENVYSKIRKVALGWALVVSFWLVFKSISSLADGEFNWKFLFAALLLQVIFIPVFANLPKQQDILNSIRQSNRQRTSTEKVAQKAAKFLTILLIFLLVIFFVGDLTTMPELIF